jgi:hypothetical protein
MQHEFPIIPPPSTAQWPLWLGAVIMLAMVGLFIFLASSGGREKFVISSDGLKISGSLYGRSIPASNLLVEQARAVDLTRDAEFRLGMRRNGTGLPGYKAGWFSLPNRNEKALAFLTDRTKVAAVPTGDGYVVLLSVADPEQFVQLLRGTVKP